LTAIKYGLGFGLDYLATDLAVFRPNSADR